MASRHGLAVLTAAFRTTPRIITIIGFGSFAILLLKILWLNYRPELFPRAAVLGDLSENILAATFAAYVFFVISYQVPQVIERQRIGRSIMQLAYSVVTDIYGIYLTMAFPPPPQLKLNEVTLEMVQDRFRSLSPREPSRLIQTLTTTRVPWIEALIAYKDRFCGHIDKIWRYSRFIDPELAAMLDRVEFSQFARDMQTLKDFSGDNISLLTNPNLVVWAPAYFECFQVARDLARYCDRYVKLYGLQ